MLSKVELLTAISNALEVESVGMADSDDTIDTWDSLGQLSIQTNLSSLTGGESDEISELAVAYSVKQIVALLSAAGLLNDY
jgi:hypothetical protein